MGPGSARTFILLGATALIAAACSPSPLSHNPSAQYPSPHASTPSGDLNDLTPEERLAELRRVTGESCTPNRNANNFRSGMGLFCVPFDSIPAIDDPTFVPASEADFLPAVEPVAVVEIGGEDRAYPIRILNTHEVVNDVVAGRPIVVSFCPLCNSTAGFSREVDGRTLTFGVSGQLLSSNLVMFDRETISLWQQVSGEAYAGEFEGKKLERILVQMVSFGSWRTAHPDGVVMEEPAPNFDYGRDPYATYADDPAEGSKFFGVPGSAERGDDRLLPKARLIGVQTAAGAVAFPIPEGGGRFAVQDATLGGGPLVAFWRKGTALTGLSTRLDEAPRGWSGTVWVARLDGKRLHFRAGPSGFVERRTGSGFDLFGRGTSGPLKGRTLKSIPQITAFWFSWSDSYPDTKIAGNGG